jgi:hypothetical protein
VGLELGPFSIVSTIEELLGRNSSGFGLGNREYGHGDSLRWPLDTLYPQKLALSSPASGDRSAGIVRSRTKATEFVFVLVFFFSVVLASFFLKSTDVFHFLKFFSNFSSEK